MTTTLETPPVSVATAFDGSAQAWATLLAQTGFGISGDVLLMTHTRDAPVSEVAHWLVAASAVTFSKTAAGYASAQAILTPSYASHAPSLRKWWGGVTNGTPDAVCSLAAATLDELMCALLSLPPESAAIVAGIEQIRATVVPEPEGASVQTWIGTECRLRTFEERHAGHLTATVEAILRLAAERKLFVTVVGTLPGFEPEWLPEAVRNSEQFNWCGESPTTSDRQSAALGLTVAELRAGSLPIAEAIARMDALIPFEHQRALARSQIYFSAGEFATAWVEISSHLSALVKTAGVPLLLQMAHTARAAGEREHASELIERAEHAGIAQIEDIRSAFLLTHSLGEKARAAALLARLEREDPDDEFTLQHRRNRFLAAKDYAGAAEASRRLGHAFDAEMWTAFAQPEPDEDALLARAAQVGREDDLRLALMLRAADRDDLSIAEYWARLVSPDSEHCPHAMRMRIRAFAQSVLGANKARDEHVEELVPLLEYVAHHPSERAVRSDLESVLDEHLPSSDVLVMLQLVLGRLLAKVTTQGFSVARANSLNTAPEPLPDEAAREFIDDVTAVLRPRGLVLGRPEFPDALRSRISPALLSQLVREAQYGELPFRSRSALLEFLIVSSHVAREVRDSSADLLIAKLFIQKLAGVGLTQPARHLAEEVLRGMPGMQDENRAWRTGLAWLCVAESFVSARHSHAALTPLCLALTAMSASSVDAEVFCKALRLIARMYRDIRGFAELALKIVEMERSIREKIGATDLIWQLDQLEISIRCRLIDGSSEGDVLALLRRTHEALLALPPRVEKMPLVALSVSLLRTARIKRIEVPPEYFAACEAPLAEESGPVTDVLRLLLRGQISRAELGATIDHFSEAVREGDLATQIQPVRLLAGDALAAAGASNDAELFLLAAALLSQPVLSAQADSPNIEVNPDTGPLRRWLAARVEDSATTAEQLTDATRLVREHAPPDNISLRGLAEMTLSDLCATLCTDEAALLVAQGPADELCSCLIRRDELPEVHVLDPGLWSPERYREWRRTFPEGYRPRTDAGPASLTREALRTSTGGLTLGLDHLPASLVILPSADLFDFTFPFTSAGDGMLGEMTRLSVAPSARWLEAVRGRGPHPNARCCAWLGAPASQDEAIRDLHKYIGANLPGYGVELISSDAPCDLAGAALAILGAHGERGSTRDFRKITDQRNHLAPVEVAELVRGCGCVVLLVCHAARRDVPENTAETRSLVSALLAAGIRTVIASPWRLSVATAAYWTPVFLEAIGAGATAGSAAYQAARAVATHSSDPAAWGALQVFGDAGFTPAPM
ncbi:MAG: CHAT domain-containing protein [Chthoniobacter sp.]|nr:CHAT domain-containing protein [Chthoniobacter sp.]